MNTWLEQAREQLAAAVGDAAAAYELSEREVDKLLDLARVAAHESGERTTAPILSYLVGLAHGRHPELSLDDLAEAVAAERAA